MLQSMTLFDFSKDSNLSNWRILDDVVMGGRSNGIFKLNEDNHGEFSGKISLENNGGFSSVRYYFEKIETSSFSKFTLRIKGDGKKYQFRVKDDRNRRHSYIFEFTTNGDWQTIEIPFSQMYPSFRGYTLNIPNFGGKHIEEIAFLIGNKKEEQFKLLIDSIGLK
jgi:NADH dehydrogenase [ubiquinone] 1 alpha subcomplex assembly factor 1